MVHFKIECLAGAAVRTDAETIREAEFGGAGNVEREVEDQRDISGCSIGFDHLVGVIARIAVIELVAEEFTRLQNPQFRRRSGSELEIQICSAWDVPRTILIEGDLRPEAILWPSRGKCRARGSQS